MDSCSVYAPNELNGGLVNTAVIALYTISSIVSDLCYNIYRTREMYVGVYRKNILMQ